MLLFLSVKDENELKRWSEWTDALLLENPNHPIALYLSSDAKARLGNLDEALQGLTKALEKKNDFALAYNARGVNRVLTNDGDNALIDFLQSTQADPKLADTYANLGSYWVFEEASDGAIDAFNQALVLNPEFALAYNGLGCAYFGRGEFENAAQCFSMASQLSPILAVAEINQGFAFAYASQLAALGSMEKKPGTTLEFTQQYKEILEKQNQEALKMLPSQKDHEFFKKMDALPRILQSPEKTQALIKEYGLPKVLMGKFLKESELVGQITELNQKVQTLYGKMNDYNRRIWNLRVAEFWTSLGTSALGAGMDLQGASKDLPKALSAMSKSEARVGKAIASSYTSDPTLKTIIDAIPPGVLVEGAKGLLPIGLIGSIASSGFKIARAFPEAKYREAQVEFQNLTTEIQLKASWLQAVRMNSDKLGETFTTQPPPKSSSLVPGYFTSTDRPITELGSLASMADKTIKSTPSLSRSALIVSGEQFRSNLLQSALNKYGIQSKVVPPTADIQTEAKRFGADVILGIKKTTEMRMPQLPTEDPTKKYFDFRKPYAPPFPPDKGGGGAGIGTLPTAPPQIKQNWDWGKQFIPVSPKGAPGGVSTEELARSFVDKGNWPVLTSFSLFYTAIPSKGEENMERNK